MLRHRIPTQHSPCNMYTFFPFSGAQNIKAPVPSLSVVIKTFYQQLTPPLASSSWHVKLPRCGAKKEKKKESPNEVQVCELNGCQQLNFVGVKLVTKFISKIYAPAALKTFSIAKMAAENGKFLYRLHVDVRKEAKNQRMRTTRAVMRRHIRIIRR